jgi:hypothetical protein
MAGGFFLSLNLSSYVFGGVYFAFDCQLMCGFLAESERSTLYRPLAPVSPFSIWCISGACTPRPAFVTLAVFLKELIVFASFTLSVC